MDGNRDTTAFEVKERIQLPPLGKDSTPRNLKILLVYPNYSMVNLLPTNVGILAACLRQNGFTVDLFDTTFYRTSERTLDEIRVENLQVRKFSLDEFGVRFKTSDFLDDFKLKVHNFKPDLIGVTAVEDTWPQAKKMIEAVADFPATVIVGGVFPTLAPEIPFSHPDVDAICIGEGKHALVELATKMSDNEDWSDVQNLWVKKDGGSIRNTMRPPIDMDDVPFGDFDLFEEERFYRPMQGKVVRMVPIETDRGCPYKCRFCEAPSLVGLYKENTGQYYFRRKSWKKVREELELYIEKHNAEYVYFNAETFLAMSDAEFDEFVAMYQDIRLPFWCQTRIETINEHRLRGLEKVNCNRISIGLEHGNEQFRKDMVGKGFSNSRIIEVFQMFNESTIPITINNILGFPGETRELIFDTIELNRKLGADSINAYYYTPYHGTPLRQDAIDKGYVSEDAETGTLITGSSVLNMPTISRDEIMGLVRTFSLYAKFPREEWGDIKIAERFDAEGDAKFAELSKKYYERFFDHDFKATRKACISSAIYDRPKKVATEDITN